MRRAIRGNLDQGDGWRICAKRGRLIGCLPFGNRFLALGAVVVIEEDFPGAGGEAVSQVDMVDEREGFADPFFWFENDDLAVA